MNLEVKISDSPAEVSSAIAEIIWSKANEKKLSGEFLNIAVSGGSTPLQLFGHLASKYLNIFPWHTLRIFWVDERCVPPTHSESNFRMTYEALLSKVPIPEGNIFRMKGEENPTDEALCYSLLLSVELPEEKKYPVFHMVLLGIGDDGHTASIFPNQLYLDKSEESVAVATHPLSGQQRITLTGNTIRNAKQVIFMVTGENKAKIIDEIKNKKPEAAKYPASRMCNNNGEAEFYIDRAAAGLLDG